MRNLAVKAEREKREDMQGRICGNTFTIGEEAERIAVENDYDDGPLEILYVHGYCGAIFFAIIILSSMPSKTVSLR
jgi:hypothetical protein